MVSSFVWRAAVVVLTGVMQWLVLRRQVARAVWWIPASIAAYFCGMAAVYMLFSFVLSNIPHLSELIWGGVTITGPVLSLIWGAVLGAITGAALVWLLRQPAIPAKAEIQEIPP